MSLLSVPPLLRDAPPGAAWWWLSPSCSSGHLPAEAGTSPTTGVHPGSLIETLKHREQHSKLSISIKLVELVPFDRNDHEHL